MPSSASPSTPVASSAWPGLSFAAHDAPDVAVVFGVYVDSAHRGHGFGRRSSRPVLDDLVDRGTIRTARLGVNRGRQAALALYRSLGFAVVGREERDEPRPWVELTMERPIR
jgi:ribosomal protein S18 acetylase RimI-like enzyme